jgi:peptide/nickel transport system permease protein
MFPTVVAISMVSFIVIQLPPGDFLTSYVAGLEAEGEEVDTQELDALRERYGLDQPVYVQYWKWISGIVFRGDFGQSFAWQRPVSELIWGRVGLNAILSLATILFIWLVAIPIGIYSAVKKYSLGDYVFTSIGFVGLATPNFLLALVFMYISFRYFGQSVGGLFSPEFVDAPWSIARVFDLLSHIWIPVIVLGTAGTAGQIRIMRANLLDELRKPYVTTARAKGLAEMKLLVRYPVRLALNPFVSGLNNLLARLFSGAAIVSIVLSLPTTGPLLLQALTSQDMYLAGSFILIESVLVVVGTLLSDVLLATLDPRIRYT